VLAAVLLIFIVLEDNAELRHLARSLNGQIATLQSEVTQRDIMISSLTSTAVRILTLTGRGTTPEARGRIFWDEGQRHWVVYVNNLPPAPAGQTYQLWFLPKGGKPAGIGVFNTGKNSSAEVQIDLPDNLGDLMSAGVSMEPAAGVPQPTGPFALTTVQ